MARSASREHLAVARSRHLRIVLERREARQQLLVAASAAAASPSASRSAATMPVSQSISVP